MRERARGAGRERARKTSEDRYTKEPRIELRENVPDFQEQFALDAQAALIVTYGHSDGGVNSKSLCLIDVEPAQYPAMVGCMVGCMVVAVPSGWSLQHPSARPWRGGG